MPLLSSGFLLLLQSFASLFDARVWNYAQLLLLGAILAPGKRTVTAVLRIVGRGSGQLDLVGPVSPNLCSLGPAPGGARRHH